MKKFDKGSEETPEKEYTKEYEKWHANEYIKEDPGEYPPQYTKEYENEDHLKKFRGITWILFVVYLLALVWIAVFKMSFPVSALEGERMFNLIPFSGTVELLGKVPLADLILQGLLFIPFGIYMGMLKPHLPVIIRIAPAICASVIIETIEILLNTGIFDVTDICMNIAGAAGGIIIEYVIFRIFHEHYEKVLLVSMAVFSVVLMMIVASGLA